VKHFFLAIYNVSVVGGAMYFFSLYGAKSVETLVILRCVGIFVSATLPVLIIMGPKFTAIQYKIITGKALWGSKGSMRFGKDNSSSASVAPVEGQKLKTLAVPARETFSGKACTAMQVIPERVFYEYRSPNNKKISFSSQSRSISQSQSHSQSVSDVPELPTPVEEISSPYG
jgi:hypothetical protein